MIFMYYRSVKTHLLSHLYDMTHILTTYLRNMTDNTKYSSNLHINRVCAPFFVI